MEIGILEVRHLKEEAWRLPEWRGWRFLQEEVRTDEKRRYGPEGEAEIVRGLRRYPGAGGSKKSGRSRGCRRT
ncbi:MAG: hypothetical protein ACLTLQ_02015 [[Clostridium] scindens]